MGKCLSIRNRGKSSFDSKLSIQEKPHLSYDSDLLSYKCEEESYTNELYTDDIIIEQKEKCEYSGHKVIPPSSYSENVIIVNREESISKIPTIDDEETDDEILLEENIAL